MNLENKLIYRWLPWLIAVVFLCLFVILLLHEWAQQERQWQKNLKEQQASIQASLLSSQQNAMQQAMLLAQIIAQDQVVVKLLSEAYQAHVNEGGNQGGEVSAQWRAQLNQLIQPYWKSMFPVGVREINIYFNPRGTVFLRAHNVEKFGDNAVFSNPLVVDVLAQGEAQSALNVGRFGSRYHAVVPVYAEASRQKTLAGIEVSFDVLSLITRQIGQEQAVLLHPAVVDNVLWHETQADVRSNTGANVGQWGLENFTDPLIKAWLNQGLLPNPIADQEFPRLLYDHGKPYLLCLNQLEHKSESSLTGHPTSPRLSGLPAQTSLLATSTALILTWSDISHAFTVYHAQRSEVAIKYLIELLVAELAVWCLFHYSHRYVTQLSRDYSQQLQQEHDASERAQQRLNLALVSSESGIWEWNIATNRAILSKEWRELCGLIECGDADADVEEWLTRIHPSDKKACHTEMLRHIKGETPMLEAEYRLRIANGSYIWIFTRGKVVEWELDGRALLIVGVYTNITKRKQDELIRLRQHAALTALNEIAAVAPTTTIEDQLSRGLAIGAHMLNVPMGSLSRIQGNQYHVIANVESSVNGIDPLSNHFCEETYRRQKVFVLDNAKDSAYATHRAFQQHKIVSYIGVPVWLNHTLYGTLSFVATQPRDLPYDTLDQDFMHLLARWVTSTLEYWQHQSEQQVLLDRFAKLSENLPKERNV